MLPISWKLLEITCSTHGIRRRFRNTSCTLIGITNCRSLILLPGMGTICCSYIQFPSMLILFLSLCPPLFSHCFSSTGWTSSTSSEGLRCIMKCIIPWVVGLPRWRSCRCWCLLGERLLFLQDSWVCACDHPDFIDHSTGILYCGGFVAWEMGEAHPFAKLWN